ncbi:MAG: hypothetical protein HY287_10940 [Planctomycetes bacterium]|nr:hypothetical protein [Planctomycetota bacterium]MBI3834835.1 hypothetical protein [Planctomycetota bacterium]
MWMKYSVEFCGGTHVKNTSEIEAFVLTHEEGVAKGVRRVVGISGEAAKKAIALGDQLLAEVNALVRQRGNETRRQEDNPPQSPLSKGGGSLAKSLADFQERFADAQIPLRTRRQIQSVLADVQKLLKEQEKQAAASSGDAVINAAKALFESAQTIGGVTVVVGEVPAANADALRAAIDWIRNKTTASAVLLATVEDGKVTLVAGMSKAVVEKGLKAGDLIKEICPLVGGKGGGRPDMAQGGGTDASGLANALDRSKQWIAQRLQ